MVSLLIGIALAGAASTLYSLGIAVQALDARDAVRSTRCGSRCCATSCARPLAVRHGHDGAGLAAADLGARRTRRSSSCSPRSRRDCSCCCSPASGCSASPRAAASSLSVARDRRRRRRDRGAGPGPQHASRARRRSRRRAGAAGRRRVHAVPPSSRRAQDRERDDDRRRARLRLERARQPVRRRRRSERPLGTAISWAAAAAAAAVVGLTCEMSALQRRPAILVAPVVFVVQTLVPVLLAPLVVHASFLDSPLSGVPLLRCLSCCSSARP